MVGLIEVILSHPLTKNVNPLYDYNLKSKTIDTVSHLLHFFDHVRNNLSLTPINLLVSDTY